MVARGDHKSLLGDAANFPQQLNRIAVGVNEADFA
jgi:hypothetical protein